MSFENLYLQLCTCNKFKRSILYYCDNIPIEICGFDSILTCICKYLSSLKSFNFVYIFHFSSKYLQLCAKGVNIKYVSGNINSIFMEAIL